MTEPQTIACPHSGCDKVFKSQRGMTNHVKNEHAAPTLADVVMVPEGIVEEHAPDTDVIEQARGLADARWGATTDHNEAVVSGLYALTKATLALAEEQRTANLIALLNAPAEVWQTLGLDGQQVDEEQLAATVCARLGIGLGEI